MFDKIFKIGLLLIGGCFAYAAIVNAQTGRYAYYAGNELLSVLDTKSGKAYALRGGTGEGRYVVEIDFVHGKFRDIK